jgi:cation:H+ antiporter
MSRVDPIVLAIALTWIGGVAAIRIARSRLAKKSDNEQKKGSDDDEKAPRFGTRSALLWFAAAALLTLVAGTALEITSERIASDAGINGAVFGATVLAAATAMPEISTGIRSVHLEDYELAVSDIFGGNAVLPVLFLPAGLIAGTSVLAEARTSDVIIASLGILLTAIYLAGAAMRENRRILRLGFDSWFAATCFAAGVALMAFAS